MDTVALLGTGLLGTGFAENLITKGHTVRVWNRTRSRAEPLGALGATVVDTPADAVRGASRVHLVLAEDTAVDAVVDALLPALGAGVPVIDHSTNLPAKVAARVARLMEAGVTYVHAPVFMNGSAARNATGLMLVSGPRDRVAPLEPVLATMTGTLWPCGDAPEHAATLKLAGNGMLITMAGIMGDLYELGAHSGLGTADIDALFQRFNPGALVGYVGSRVAVGGVKPASFELTMARKDVRLMIESAGGPDGLVVLPRIAEVMDARIAEGHGAKDYAFFGWPRRHGGG